MFAALLTPLRGDWTSVSSVGPARRIAKGVEYSSREGPIRIQAVMAGVMRVRFVTGKEFAPDDSWAVLPDVAGANDAPFQFQAGSKADQFKTSELTVDIQRNPFRLRFADSNGRVLNQDTDAMGMAHDPEGRIRVAKNLDDNMHFFGFGEKTGPLDKRGSKLGGSMMTMWNADVYGYGDAVDPLYDDIPFFITLRDGIAHGTFFDNTWRSSFDIGKASRKYFEFGAEGGELDYYLIAGPKPADVLRRYTELTGRMPMPPLWSLGFNQSRYSYYPEARVREIARNFRDRHIPADVLWFDIHYMDGYRIFTWDPKRFPDPAKLLRDLGDMNLKTVAILDPGVKADPNYAAYQSGLKEKVFVKKPDGNLFIGPVWPGDAAFPDFTDDHARDWWAKQIAAFASVGLAGIWNDMNEPAVFNVASGTMPDDVIFHRNGKAISHAEAHNVFGQQMSRATREGLLRLRPGQRPFVLTRDTYSGGQRYAAVWTGDNTADWAHLKDGITTLLGLGLSGVPFVGNDIGGFIGKGDAELWTRWAQAGAFFPFMRAHAEDSAPDKEPWAYGPEFEGYNRTAIERRYRFLPYIYNCFHETAETGMPMMRALVLQYPDDPATPGISDEYLFGSDLLVAPVLQPHATGRQVYLPKGDWYDLRDDRQLGGGKSVSVTAPIDELPLFVPEGAILFRAPVMQSTAELASADLIYEVFAHGATKREYFEDDGISWPQAAFFRRTISFEPSAAGATVTLEAAAGSYLPLHGRNVVQVHFARQPRSVTLNGRAAPGFRFDAGTSQLFIPIPQSRERQTIRMEW